MRAYKNMNNSVIDAVAELGPNRGQSHCFRNFQPAHAALRNWANHLNRRGLRPPTLWQAIEYHRLLGKTTTTTGKGYERGTTRMGVIKKRVHEEKQPVALRLEVGVVNMLAEYAKYLNDSKDYVVTEALKYVWHRDPDFQAYLQANQLAGVPAKRANGKPKTAPPPTPAAVSAGKV